MNSFFGGSSSSSSSSSRRGKKSSSNAAEKPKQPQRGLGVAQLEKIRLHSLQEEMRMKAYAAMQSPTTGRQSHQSQDFAPAAPIPYGNYQAHYQTPTAYDYHPSMMQNPNFGYQDSYCYTTQDGMNTRHFLNNMQDSRPKGSPYFESGLSSGSGDNQDVDLELKL